MGLQVIRSPHTEALVDELARLLVAAGSTDPFEPLPIVVGSRGMERWLRQELATRLGQATLLSFPLIGQLLDRATRWLVADARPERRLWEAEPQTAQGPWSAAVLTLRLLPLVRSHLGEAAFAGPARFLDGVGSDDPVGARELTLCAQLAGEILALLHDRPVEVLAWLARAAGAATDSEARGRSPELQRDRVDAGSVAEGRERWVEALVVALHADAEADRLSPARLYDQLRRRAPRSEGLPPLFVFGLSTLRPGDKLRLALLARHLDLQLLLLSPTSAWVGDLVSEREERRLRRRAGALTEEREQELQLQNPLLRASGVPSRDLQRWVLELSDELEVDDRELASRLPAQPRTLLEAVQQWIVDAGERPARGAWRDHAGCPSLQLHATHGSLRQVEALRDELLRRFSLDATLEPRHVLVMTPDVATYAPLLAAVFERPVRAGNGAQVPSLPLHIADLGLRARNPVAEALLSVLALGSERVTAARLVALLGQEPVRARFGLDEEDVELIRALVQRSGARWGWDAADRARHGQPRSDLNTLRFGLERLALGVLMPDEGGLSVIEAMGARGAATGELQPAVPLEVFGRESADRVGRLLWAIRTIESVVEELSPPRGAEAWRAQLGHAIEALTLVTDDQVWLRARVFEELEELLPSVEGPPLAREAVQSLLEGHFELPQRGDRPVTGAITVCAIEPMRSVPFRVIALLGMDEDAFPRRASRPSWSPLLPSRPMEYDRRVVDRHMFLETLLSARDALLLFGAGFEPRAGEPVPQSIVVEELAELLKRACDGTSDSSSSPGWGRVRHPLQPWSEAVLEGATVRTFDSALVAAALQVRAVACGELRPTEAGMPASRRGTPWPRLTREALTLDADSLATTLCKPQRALLHDVLRLEVEHRVQELEEREPLDADSLEEWGLRRQLLETLILDEQVRSQLETRLRAEGDLPAYAAGEQLLDQLAAQARAIRALLAGLAGEHDSAPARFVARVAAGQGSLLLTAVAPHLVRCGDEEWLVFTTASKVTSGRARMSAWCALLVASLDPEAGSTLRGALLIGMGDKQSTGLRAYRRPVDPLAIVQALLEVRTQLLRQPVLLFPFLSEGVAKQLAKLGPEQSLRQEVDRLWNRNKEPYQGLLTDPWVDTLFGHYGEEELLAATDELVQLAEQVWSPLLTHESHELPEELDGEAVGSARGTDARRGS
jgi:exodeoxyribonuclease V gamma subunit